MTDNKLWKIIQDIGWPEACITNKDNKEKRPYDVVGDRIAEKYPEYILELRNFAKKERKSLVSFLSGCGIRTGGDSGWDLTAHIIGCGENYLKDVKERVNAGEYTMDNIYDEIPWQENFEYSFSYAIEKIIGSEKASKKTRDSDYLEWLRNRKIDKIIN